MSNLGLFVAGAAVSLLVLVAMAILVWAAIEDGRYNTEQQRLAAANAEERAGRRTAA